MTPVTPAMIKAAWVEARRWWPRKVVQDGKRFIVLETCIAVDEPQPGFREAIEAALRESGRGIFTPCLYPMLRGSGKVLAGCWGLNGLGAGGLQRPRRRHLRVRLPTSGFPTPAAGGFALPASYQRSADVVEKRPSGNVNVGDCR